MRKMMIESPILQEAVEMKKVNRKGATHFVIFRRNRVRYLIDLHGGKEKLRLNLSPYSKKLWLLMKLLNILPFSILKMLKMGEFVSVKLHPEIEKHLVLTKTDTWNVIVGTYDEKQKLVLQCYTEKGPAFYVKVGNSNSAKEMQTEMQFLNCDHLFETFRIPDMVEFFVMREGAPFNIQITKEFVGDKVKPVLTKEIINIYREVSSKTKVVDNVVYECSHGDFAPWNMKCDKGRYILFDWENYGYRIKGFDLMHYVMIIEVVLRGRNLSSAFINSIKQIRRFIPDFTIDKDAFLNEFCALRKQTK